MKVEVDVLGSPSLTVFMPYGLCVRKAALNRATCVTELRSCSEIEVDVLMVSVNVKQH